MTTYIIYHQRNKNGQRFDCSDGVVAKFLVERKLRDRGIEPVIYGWDYKDPSPQFPEAGDTLYIVDFSFEPAIVNSWIDRGIEIYLFDHHRSALQKADQYSPQIKGILREGECGATLVWEYFYPDEPMPPMLKYVRDRDMNKDGFWNLSIGQLWESNTLLVHTAMGKIGRTNENLEFLMHMDDQELLSYLDPVGRPDIERDRQIVEEYANYASFYRIPCASNQVVESVKAGTDPLFNTLADLQLPSPFPSRNNFPIYFVDLSNQEQSVVRLVSVIGKQMAVRAEREQQPALMVLRTDTHSYEIRSNSSFRLDCTALAYRYGDRVEEQVRQEDGTLKTEYRVIGGGHFNAAGFTCSEPIFS